MGEGIFLLFLTPAAPDYHILHSEPKKHHSAMLQLGRLPSPARERTGGTQRGAGVCMRGCKRASACTRGPWGTASFNPSRCGTAACIPPDGAERSPAACKRVCFSSPAPNSIRTNCIWERGGVFGWVWGFYFAFSLKSWDGNLRIVTQHAVPAPSQAKTQKMGTGSKIRPLYFPSHEQTAWHGKAVIGEPACLMK